MSDPRGVFDPNRRKEIPYLMSKLDGGQPSTVIYKSLSCLRSYFFSSFSSAIHPKLKTAVENGQLLKALLKLLEKPNAKIVDVTLSILGNLFLVESVRIQVLKNQWVSCGRDFIKLEVSFFKVKVTHVGYLIEKFSYRDLSNDTSGGMTS